MGETEPVKCPFCGAPYREIVPADVVQVKCEYCGGVFHVPPTIEAEVPGVLIILRRLLLECATTVDRASAETVSMPTNFQHGARSATLYLCPDSLKARYNSKIRGYIIAGAFMLLMGVFFTIASPVPGVLILVFGLVSLFYGVSSRSGAVQESTVDELKDEQEKKKAELAESEGVDSDAMYDELVARYENHWGPSLGIQLLDDEINACMRHGQSFPEAVMAVYRRQEKKPAKQESS